MRFSLIIAALSSLLLTPAVRAQESLSAESAPAEKTEPALPVGLPVKLDISRQFLKNFLSDEAALEPYRTGDDTMRDFDGAFTIGSPAARFVPIWDPFACRLVGILDLQSPPVSGDSAAAPYLLLAEGRGPTFSINGANGSPVYFGFRLEQGRPEFLYTHGAHAISEKIWLEDEGAVMKQHFALRKPVKTLTLSFPESWIPRITASDGEWQGGSLTVTGDAVAEVTLLYRLDTPESAEKEESE